MRTEVGEGIKIELRLLARIQLHTAKNPILGRELRDIFGLNDIRDVTTIIETLRDNGHKIASSKGGFNTYLGVTIDRGYFLARTPEEMRATYDHYQDLIKDYSARAKKLMDFKGEETLWQQRSEGEAA